MAGAGVAFRSAPTISGSQSAPVAHQHAAYPLQAALDKPMTPPPYPSMPGGRPLTPAMPGNAKPAVTRPHPLQSPRNVLILVGTAMVVLVIITPVWNSLLLMSDPVFVFFVGRRWPLWTIAACGAAVVAYPLAIMFFFKFAREETQRDTSILTIATIIVTALGLALLLLSLPIMSDTQAAFHNIIGNCEFGPRTRGLYSYASVLQGLRSEPGCAEKDSVEYCKGYQESQPHTGFLKALETGFKCSGFCSSTASMAAGDAAWAASAPAPSPRGSLAKAMHLVVIPSAEASEPNDRAVVPAESEDKGSAGRRAGLLQANSTRQADPEPQMGSRPYTRPPTLFTTANYDASCDGLAAWDVKFTGEHTGQLFYQQGVILLFCTVVVGLLKIVTTSVANFSARGGGKQQQDVQRQRLQQQIQQRLNTAPIVT